MHGLLRQLAAKPQRFVVGLISGTSVDGIDAILVRLEGAGARTRFEVIAFESRAWPQDLRQSIFALFEAQVSLDELCRLNFVLGRQFAEAALAVVAAAGMRPAEIDLIGSHGQTVRHLPDGQPGSTLQIGESAVIAQRTGITTIADFRPADMALGGQGAPLVPLADCLLFGGGPRRRLLLNIGGIANVTVLPAGAGPEEVSAFDLGPGNALMDAAAVHFSGGAERFDRGGVGAAAGQVETALLQQLLEHEYFRRPPPKSTGRELFGAQFLQDLLGQWSLNREDWLATLAAFSAATIGQGIGDWALPAGEAADLWVGGGGCHNRHLMGLLAEQLPGVQVGPIDDLGVSADAREALCFAVLANETLAGHPGNVPGATGAQRGAVLGKIVPGY